MPVFDDLDAIMLRNDLVLFGRAISLHPMAAAASGVNAAPEADPERGVIEEARAIRSEWSERAQIGGQGLPTPTGAFKLAAMGIRHIATVMPSLLAWTPRKGDEIEYADRPGQRYRISEPMPDGGVGLHLGLSKL